MSRSATVGEDSDEPAQGHPDAEALVGTGLGARQGRAARRHTRSPLHHECTGRLVKPQSPPPKDKKGVKAVGTTATNIPGIPSRASNHRKNPMGMDRQQHEPPSSTVPTPAETTPTVALTRASLSQRRAIRRSQSAPHTHVLVCVCSKCAAVLPRRPEPLNCYHTYPKIMCTLRLLRPCFVNPEGFEPYNIRWAHHCLQDL